MPRRAFLYLLPLAALGKEPHPAAAPRQLIAFHVRPNGQPRHRRNILRHALQRQHVLDAYLKGGGERPGLQIDRVPAAETQVILPRDAPVSNLIARHRLPGGGDNGNGRFCQTVIGKLRGRRYLHVRRDGRRGGGERLRLFAVDGARPVVGVCPDARLSVPRKVHRLPVIAPRKSRDLLLRADGQVDERRAGAGRRRFLRVERAGHIFRQKPRPCQQRQRQHEHKQLRFRLHGLFLLRAGRVVTNIPPAPGRKTPKQGAFHGHLQNRRKLCYNGA